MSRSSNGPNIKIIKSSDIARCPIRSWAPEHYNEDGSCKCCPVCRAQKQPISQGET